MVGGGIFTILGVAVSQVGFLAPFAIALGGVLAFFAAYLYVKLGTFCFLFLFILKYLKM